MYGVKNAQKEKIYTMRQVKIAKVSEVVTR